MKQLSKAEIKDLYRAFEENEHAVCPVTTMVTLLDASDSFIDLGAPHKLV